MPYPGTALSMRYAAILTRQYSTRLSHILNIRRRYWSDRKTKYRLPQVEMNAKWIDAYSTIGNSLFRSFALRSFVLVALLYRATGAYPFCRSSLKEQRERIALVAL